MCEECLTMETDWETRIPVNNSTCVCGSGRRIEGLEKREKNSCEEGKKEEEEETKNNEVSFSTRSANLITCYLKKRKTNNETRVSCVRERYNLYQRLPFARLTACVCVPKITLHLAASPAVRVLSLVVYFFLFFHLILIILSLPVISLSFPSLCCSLCLISPPDRRTHNHVVPYETLLPHCSVSRFSLRSFLLILLSFHACVPIHLTGGVPVVRTDLLEGDRRMKVNANHTPTISPSSLAPSFSVSGGILMFWHDFFVCFADNVFSAASPA